MRIRLQFFSYFKDLTGVSQTTMEIPEGTTLDQFLDQVYLRYSQLSPARRATLVAVDVDYQSPEYKLKDGDEVSLFPPVQGG